MSADREKNQDMAQVAHGDTAHSDITFLLAGAADGVEIGIAPYQAVVRGGRRRRARRWAVASAAALVIATSTGALALAAIGNDKGDEVTRVATRPPTAEERHVYAPQRTTLATGADRGKAWRVTVDIWGAPRNEEEAVRQFSAMTESGVDPVDAKIPKDLVGRGSFFVHRSLGDTTTPVMMGDIDKTDGMSGTDLDSAALPLEPNAADNILNRLVIGKVAATVQAVTCTWNDGTTSVARKAPTNSALNSKEPLIRPVAGSQAAWFVCLAEYGKAFKSVRVTG
jgi:hypothetical protein